MNQHMNQPPLRVRRTITERYQPCQMCFGTGRVPNESTAGSQSCSFCHGSGQIIAERTVIEDQPWETP